MLLDLKTHFIRVTLLTFRSRVQKPRRGRAADAARRQYWRTGYRKADTDEYAPHTYSAKRIQARRGRRGVCDPGALDRRLRVLVGHVDFPDVGHQRGSRVLRDLGRATAARRRGRVGGSSRRRRGT